MAAAALVAGGIGVGLAMAHDRAARGPGRQPGTVAGSGSGSTYAYYRSTMADLGVPGSVDSGDGSMMGRSGSTGTMMDGLSASSMMGAAGYTWMVGAAAPPGWMRGGSLPRFLMIAGGPGSDPGSVMGRLFADAPGSRVSTAEALRLGEDVPVGAVVDHSRNQVTVSAKAVRLVALAGPSAGGAGTFRIAGLTDPTVSVSAGAQVSIEVVNSDLHSAHGLDIAPTGSDSTPMPMMTASPSFPGAALWFLGEPTGAGAHTGTLTFTATTAGSYRYLCPVPGDAGRGMAGTFLVTR